MAPPRRWHMLRDTRMCKEGKTEDMHWPFKQCRECAHMCILRVSL